LQAVRPDSLEKVYVSRSALPNRRGGVFGEARIEALMEANGYTVIFPERLTLEKQLSIYMGAKSLVALEGSALHMAAYALPKGASVGIIGRRRGEHQKAFVWQMQSFVDAQVTLFDALLEEWVDEGKRRSDYSSIGRLDLRKVERELKEGGFISRGLGLVPLTDAEVEADIFASGRGPMHPLPKKSP